MSIDNVPKFKKKSALLALLVSKQIKSRILLALIQLAKLYMHTKAIQFISPTGVCYPKIKLVSQKNCLHSINGETSWTQVTDYFTGTQHGAMRHNKGSPIE